jgi:hypothetical protein
MKEIEEPLFPSFGPHVLGTSLFLFYFASKQARNTAVISLAVAQERARLLLAAAQERERLGYEIPRLAS